jgi:hypothetical protein
MKKYLIAFMAFPVCSVVIAAMIKPVRIRIALSHDMDPVPVELRCHQCRRVPASEYSL